MTHRTPFADRPAPDDPIRQRDYSLVGADTQLATSTGLSGAEWYRTSVPRARMKELMQRSDGPALRDTALWLGSMIAFATAGVLTWGSWWCVPFFAAYGVLYGSGGDSRWHETGHGTAFRTQWMNAVVYQIACFMVMRNPTVWRWSHTRHHTDTLIVGLDPEIALMRPPRFWRQMSNFVGLYDGWNAMRAMLRHAVGRVSADEASYTPASDRRAAFRVARVWVVIYTTTIVVAVLSQSWLPVVLVGLPRLYGQWHIQLTGFLQHGGLADDVLDHRLNTRTVYMNPISRFIYWNMNYHVEHHMFPQVPFHRLPELHAEIRDDLPPAARSMWAAWREMLPAIWRQRRDPAYFLRAEVGGR